MYPCALNSDRTLLLEPWHHIQTCSPYSIGRFRLIPLIAWFWVRTVANAITLCSPYKQVNPLRKLTVLILHYNFKIINWVLIKLFVQKLKHLFPESEQSLLSLHRRFLTFQWVFPRADSGLAPGPLCFPKWRHGALDSSEASHTYILVQSVFYIWFYSSLIKCIPTTGSPLHPSQFPPPPVSPWFTPPAAFREEQCVLLRLVTHFPQLLHDSPDIWLEGLSSLISDGHHWIHTPPATLVSGMLLLLLICWSLSLNSFCLQKVSPISSLSVTLTPA